MTHEFAGLRAPRIEEIKIDARLAMVDAAKLRDASKVPLSPSKKAASALFAEVTIISVDNGMVRYRFDGSERTGMASIAAVTRDIDDPDPSRTRYIVPNW